MPSALNDISYELLEKALRKEQELGYTDTAARGGLEQLVEEWWRPYKVMHPDLAKWRAGVSAAIENYHESSIAERRHKIDLALGILRERSISRGELIPSADSEWPIDSSLISSTGRKHRARTVFGRRTITNAAILIGAAVLGLIAYFYLPLFVEPQAPELPSFLSPTVVLLKSTPTSSSTACPKGCEEPPPGCLIKGNINIATGEKIYHVPGGKFYDATVISPRRGERWFCTEEEARTNGWRKSEQ